MFANNIVNDKMEILLDGKEIKFAVYDMTRNVVKSSEGRTWDLRNTAGRYVANGTYLVIVEDKDKNGKVYRYSAKLGVKR